MSSEKDRPSDRSSVRLYETGIRVALEEILTGRNYARVEDILRALADRSDVPTCSGTDQAFTDGKPPV